MRPLKLAVIFAATLFIFACGNSATPSNQVANSNLRGANASATNASAASATPAKTAATPDELAAVRGVYSQYCQRCHRPDGTGGDFDLDGKNIKVPSLREHGLKDSDASLERHILNGGKNMPPFKNRLEPDVIKQLVRFVRVEFHGRSAAATADKAPANNNASTNAR